MLMSFAKAVELVRLATLATRSRGITLDDIVSDFDCCRRTAQRMTEALEAAFPATDRIVDEERRARWILPARAVAHLLTPSADELAALATGIAELERSGLALEVTYARQLERKVRALIPPQTGARLAVDEEALLEALGHAARPGPRLTPNAAIDSAIHHALKGPFLLRIVYRSLTDDAPRERVVAPHGLLLGVRRYLVARDTAKPRSALRHYRVDDVQEAEVLDRSFELDSGFNIHAHAERGFGSYESASELGEVVWRFRPDAAQHARRFVFHPSQSMTTLEDGSLEVRFHASGHLEMCWHLYTWGDAVYVVAPEALRLMVGDHRRADFPALP
jgi:predicted DNA-binding transcriptional regulator YafY